MTGEAARAHVHETRNRLTGITVGIGTVLADDPLLTCRMEGGRNPVRIVCDSRARIPLDSRLIRTAREVPTLIAVTEQNERAAALQAAGAEILLCRADGAGHVDLNDLMAQLGAREIDGVLLEGGASLAFAALRAGIVQRGAGVYRAQAARRRGGENPARRRRHCQNGGLRCACTT